MRPVLVVLGSLAAVVGFALVLAAAGIGWAYATQRDDDGFFRSGDHRIESTGHAVTSERIDLHADIAEADWVLADDLGTARIVAEPVEGPLFVGIGRSRDVDRYLRDVEHDRVTDLRGSLRVDVVYDHVDGDRAPTPPGDAGIWAASSGGPGTRTLDWDVEAGDWTVVLMAADGQPGVVADVSVGIRTPLLGWLGVGLGVLGAIALAVAAVLLIVGLRSPARPAPTEGAAPPVERLVPGSYPATLRGELDPDTSRWLWLVKWVLVIPHALVLALLWPTMAVLTFVAGVAILCTGRYPRPIFDFNVGVLRWTWRVAFWSTAAFGTDRYPPFRLGPDPSYPADLHVEPPERLSRPLVLVKWWLLALPHLVVVTILAGGWVAGLGDDRWAPAAGGLIGVLALIAIATHAVTGTYPRGLFDLLLGLDRWVFRVAVYVALLRDEYPPFRLDPGGTDPGAELVAPPPPPPPDVPAAGPAADEELAEPLPR